jgi:hypothetical protein
MPIQTTDPRKRAHASLAALTTADVETLRPVRHAVTEYVRAYGLRQQGRGPGPLVMVLHDDQDPHDLGPRCQTSLVTTLAGAELEAAKPVDGLVPGPATTLR